MGWLLPKVYLRWREPKEATLAREQIAERAMRWWWKPAAVAILTGLMMVNWWLAGFNPNNANRPAFGTALALGFVGILILIYVLPRLVMWFFVRCASARTTVIVNERMIIYTGFGHSVQYGFKKIERCRIVTPVDDGSPTLLALDFQNGKSRILGVAPEVSLEELERVLRDRCGAIVVFE